MFCTKCGTQVADTANFCSQCGQPTPLGRQQNFQAHYENTAPRDSHADFGPPKRLYRSLNHKMLAGICGGLAEYFDADPTVVRLLYVAFIIMSGGLGLLAYLVAWMIIPLDRTQRGFYAAPGQSIAS